MSLNISKYENSDRKEERNLVAIRKVWGKRPAYKSKDFERFLKLSRITLDEFKESTVYKKAVKLGAIVDDKWQGKIKIRRARIQR